MIQQDYKTSKQNFALNKYDQQIGDQMKGDYEIDFRRSSRYNFREKTKGKRSYYMRQDQNQKKSRKRTKMTAEDEFNQFKKIYDQLRKKNRDLELQDILSKISQINEDVISERRLKQIIQNITKIGKENIQNQRSLFQGIGNQQQQDHMKQVIQDYNRIYSKSGVQIDLITGEEIENMLVEKNNKYVIDKQTISQNQTQLNGQNFFSKQQVETQLEQFVGTAQRKKKLEQIYQRFKNFEKIKNRQKILQKNSQTKLKLKQKYQKLQQIHQLKSSIRRIFLNLRSNDNKDIQQKINKLRNEIYEINKSI